MRRPWSSGSAVILLAILAVATRPAAADGWLDSDTGADSGAVHKYHLALSASGVRHLRFVGLGIVGWYGDWQAAHTAVGWGGEMLLLHSGERWIPRSEAYNQAFAADSVFGGVSHLWEQVSSVGLGATAFHVLRSPPGDYGWLIPGIAVGVACGVILEADRVGLQSSDVDLQYGVSAPSDTEVSFTPYVRPQLVLSQGSISLVGGIALLPKFASWTVGLAYSW